MKLAGFNALCEREWGDARGDVTGLRLTDESYAELTVDTLISGTPEVILLPRGELFNPVTRTVVKVAGGASEDRAEVRRYYAGAHPAGLTCT